MDIEIHHIEDRDNACVDNALPLCYDCHAKLHQYNESTPIGTKYRPKELKARREQIYDRYTTHLVPPMNFNLLQIYLDENENPRVQTRIQHNANNNPIQLKLSFNFYLGKKLINLVH